MPVSMPPTTKTFGAQSLLVLTSEPADMTALTTAEIAAGVNITCHMVGDWWPTATTEKVSRQRKMCQIKTTQSLGTTTWETPGLVYTFQPQLVGTPGSPGNEAFEVLPESGSVYLVQRIGVTGTSDLATGNAYRVIPAELGPQVDGVSADDAGGEAVINQEVAFLEGYDGPIAGVVAGP